MNRWTHFVWPLAIAGLLGLSLLSPARAFFCPFCGEGEKGATLAMQVEEAQLVLYGHFENATPGEGIEGGKSDLVIEKVLKSHPMIQGKTVLSIPRHIPSKNKFIIFAEIYKGRIDPTRGMELTNDAEMISYIEKGLALKGKSTPERLRFAFDYLNSSEFEVAMDAYREFARIDYREYKDMAAKLPADTIAGWLQDPKTPSFRYGLYASLLGHCGNAKHAELLLAMINDPEKRKGSGLHGLMAAYAMLEPTKGWSLVRNTVQDKDKPFLVRYAGLQTMRFFWEYRTDLVSKDELVKGVAGILNVTDMADFAIEDLRKWQRWEFCDQILGLYGKKDYNTPIVRKSILRYALQCPSPAAAQFVKMQRARDTEWVSETKELLEMESVPVKR